MWTENPLNSNYFNYTESGIPEIRGIYATLGSRNAKGPIPVPCVLFRFLLSNVLELCMSCLFYEQVYHLFWVNSRPITSATDRLRERPVLSQARGSVRWATSVLCNQSHAHQFSIILWNVNHYPDSLLNQLLIELSQWASERQYSQKCCLYVPGTTEEKPLRMCSSSKTSWRVLPWAQQGICVWLIARPKIPTTVVILRENFSVGL